MTRPTFLSLLAFLLPGALVAQSFDAAQATNAVGLDLYRQLASKQPEGNLVISPYSIESALALVYAGADGATRSELSRVLHFPADDAPLVAAFGGLRTALDQVAAASKATADARGKSGTRVDSIQWSAANRLFG